jgi:hypothetical protein
MVSLDGDEFVRTQADESQETRISCCSVEKPRTWGTDTVTISFFCGLTTGGSGTWSIAATKNSKHSKHATTYRSFTVPSKEGRLWHPWQSYPRQEHRVTRLWKYPEIPLLVHVNRDVHPTLDSRQDYNISAQNQ